MNKNHCFKWEEESRGCWKLRKNNYPLFWEIRKSKEEFLLFFCDKQLKTFSCLGEAKAQVFAMLNYSVEETMRAIAGGASFEDFHLDNDYPAWRYPFWTYPTCLYEDGDYCYFSNGYLPSVEFGVFEITNPQIQTEVGFLRIKKGGSVFEQTLLVSGGKRIWLNLEEFTTGIYQMISAGCFVPRSDRYKLRFIIGEKWIMEEPLKYY